NMITRAELERMKSNAIILNTSRGGIINEEDLYTVMSAGHLSGAAIDVFNNEPYDGNLKNIERCLLTAHMGSMSEDCRTRMEIEATEEAIRFASDKELMSIVPNEEYEVQQQGL
ncbi:MAG: lactate dehydrogenase, partial [Gammaproteobacteria bacterium]|nr:lactate dehydrogenase [Gammaproteobacteria bacterium]